MKGGNWNKNFSHFIESAISVVSFKTYKKFSLCFAKAWIKITDFKLGWSKIDLRGDNVIVKLIFAVIFQKPQPCLTKLLGAHFSVLKLKIVVLMRSFPFWVIAMFTKHYVIKKHCCWLERSHWTKKSMVITNFMWSRERLHSGYHKINLSPKLCNRLAYLHPKILWRWDCTIDCNDFEHTDIDVNIIIKIILKS